MAAKVVDASALAALLFGEPRAEDVASRLGASRLAAPTLLRYELASVCRKKIAAHPELRATLLGALGLVERLDIDEIDVPGEPIVELARRTRLTVYDAAYLWLARELRLELVTLDSTLEGASGRL